jgi:hypothetical protein
MQELKAHRPRPEAQRWLEDLPATYQSFNLPSFNFLKFDSAHKHSSKRAFPQSALTNLASFSCKNSAFGNDSEELKAQHSSMFTGGYSMRASFE